MTDAYRGASTTITQIQISWDALIDDGGSAITSYLLEEETTLGSGVWNALQGDVGLESLLTSFTKTGLTSGYQIFVRVTAYNTYGAGTSSSTVTLTASDVPDAPAAPVISLSNTFCRITFTAPLDNSESITAYLVEIEKSDGTFLETSYCDGSDLTVISQMYCEVPMTTIIDSTIYNIASGATIIARVSAFNAFGWSAIGA